MSWTEKAIGLFPDVLRPINKVIRGQPLSYDDWNHFRYGYQLSKIISFYQHPYVQRKAKLYVPNVPMRLRRINERLSADQTYYRQFSNRSKRFRYSSRYSTRYRYRKSKFLFKPYSVQKRFSYY